MKTTTAALLAFTLSMLALSSHADNPNNPNQPNCPPGQIAILDPDGVDGWDCKQIELTSNINPQDAGLLLPAVQKLSAAAPTAPAQPGGTTSKRSRSSGLGVLLMVLVATRV